jgi:hypothetical protein
MREDARSLVNSELADIPNENNEISQFREDIRNILLEYGNDRDIELIFDALDEYNSDEFYRRVNVLLQRN